jgi:hypothetical protein
MAGYFLLMKTISKKDLNRAADVNDKIRVTPLLPLLLDRFADIETEAAEVLR